MSEYHARVDALVAEHVMGWADVAYVATGYGDGRNNTREGYWYEWRGRRTRDTWTPHEQIPPFSTSIAHAWRVVEKMRELGWNITVCAQDMLGCTMHKFRESCYVEADSIPWAICLAALQANQVSLLPTMPPVTSSITHNEYDKGR